jgi:hypothetical protein
MLSSAPDAHYSLAELSTPVGTVKQVIALSGKMVAAPRIERGTYWIQVFVTIMELIGGAHRDTRILYLVKYVRLPPGKRTGFIGESLRSAIVTLSWR